MVSQEERVRKMEALVSLVDEPDPMVYKDISQRICAYGDEIVPFLERAWESSYPSYLQERIDTLIHQINFQKVYDDLKEWVEQGGEDLLAACMIIARYEYPNLKEEEIEYELSRIRKDIWLELNENLTALEQIKVFNYVFYEIHGFYGNVTSFHAPHNSFINKVLESKTGNPLLLGVIYLLLAETLDIPLKGVNLPEHFVLAYTGKTLDPDTLEYKHNNVLFYINAFSRGAVFSYKDIQVFLKELKQEAKPEFFAPCSHLDIVMRMVNNLINAYKKSSENHKLEHLQKLSLLLLKAKQDLV